MSDHFFIDDEGEKINADEFSKWFKKEFDRLYSGEDKLVSKVILFHLIIERHIEIYLQKNNPNLGDIRKAKLSFDAKVKLIKPKEESVADILPGIKAINKIRNKYSHNLGYKLTPDDLKPLIDFVAIGEDRKDVINLGFPGILMAFTRICCAFLQLGSTKWERKTGFSERLRGFGKK